MGHRLHRPQSSQARTQADSVRGVAVGRCRGLNKAGGVTNQVTPHPIHHRAWPMSIRHDNLDRLLEPYGMMILIGVLFILPMIGAQIGVDLGIVSHVVAAVTSEVVAIILRLTGYT